MNSIDENELKIKFNKASQSQVFQFENQLTPEQKIELYHDLQEINLDELNSSYMNAKSKKSVPSKINPFPSVCYFDESQEDRKRWEEIGLQKIHQGKTAVLLLAGGQGTRLGTTKPKGMYDIGLMSKKSLFQLQAERLFKIQELASQRAQSSKESVVSWYIMTSESTKLMTENYFKENNYFGLKPQNMFFFEQAMIPCVSPEGKIIMETPCKVARSPNGNGGIYSALLSSGALDDMERKGIQIVFVYGVDNCLVKMADPIFFGYCFEKNIDCASKVVSKSYPEEPVGIICLIDGKPGVLEYSEIDKDIEKMVDPKTGKLLYNTAHICMNSFSLNFLKKICSSKLDKLPYHIAKKKINAINNKELEKKEVNLVDIWKLEMFIFDVFEFSENMGVFEVLRNEEFSPLKNGPDSKMDSPHSCIQHITELHKLWIQKSGGIIANSNDELLCEISPLVSYCGENLTQYVKDKKISLPFHLSK